MKHSDGARARDHFDDDRGLRIMLSDAAEGAKTEREMEFVGGLQERYEKYGVGMYLSTSQLDWLERLADRSGRG